ncbi:D-alanyl-D-alanine carboxypeptidase family protein [Gordonia sp. HY285]|uniref:D-alanyl-D-alanine carboxypeptidase family protein n=1 Tax=Gordonia liuliyuniae TaxID=2911517 RepID=UPI001F01DC48|nr:D-alanyl-D-alanine carboxypeptidase family protein [Gordonia liuliyuniae]MCF8611441.1 D-alanyl-D-alanine carboxypeptidase family protein [Gordonia liuliyuniae]
MNIDTTNANSRDRSPILLGGTVAAAVLVALIVAAVVAHTQSVSSSAVSAPSTTGDLDGYIPDDDPISPFAEVSAVEKLDDELRAAVRAAARRARRDGVDVRLTSGWRSEALQGTLLRQAIREQGEDYAASHVKSSTESEHVRGLAVDVGPADAAYWMSRHGAEFGLCQVYANEVWHYELTADDGVCPPMRRDAGE